MKKIFLITLFLNFLLNASAQVQENESLMRSSGKIYVVVGIITIIFLLIVLYLVRLDRKITSLEDIKK